MNSIQHAGAGQGAVALKPSRVTRTLAPRVADLRLSAALTASAREEFWARPGTTKSAGARTTPFQYPAMMVSEMQGTLLEAVRQTRSGTPLTYDPFVGSGATMVEAMRLGLPYAGSDINPLAILIAKVRSAEAASPRLFEAIDRVCAAALALRREVRPPDEQWCQRWFREDVALDLAALRAAISLESRLVTRRLLWVALAEVVRLCGNFRISTPKLQSRPAPDLLREINAIERFRRSAEGSAHQAKAFAKELSQAGVRKRGKYLPGLTLSLGDSRFVDPVGERLADIVLASPPYGDNRTTMPYGQACYLPLKWIDTDDIGESIQPGLLDAIGTLDTRSLGGSRRYDSVLLGEAVDRSPALAGVLAKKLTPDGRKRISSFFADMNNAVAAILDRCVSDAHVVLTLGDRTVSGYEVPTTQIVEDLFVSRDTQVLTRIQRPLPRQKRLALKNQYSSTIRIETVLVMRRLRS